MDQLEKNIREKLVHYEEEPPVHVWDAIESRLNKKTSPLWLKIAAALILLVISAASLVWILPGLKPSAMVAEMPAPAIETPPQAEIPVTLSSGSLPTEPKDHKPAHGQTRTEVLPFFAANETLLPSATHSLPVNILFPEYLPLSHSTGLLPPRTPIVLAKAIPIDEKARLLSQDQTPIRLLALETTSEPMKPAWGLTAFLSPQQSYRLQTNTSNIPFEALENEIMGFSAGLHISYRIGNRIELRTGAAYNLIGQQINDIAAFSHPSMTYLYSTKGEKINNHPQSMSTSMGGINFTDQSFYFADIASSRIFTLKGSYDESNVNLLNKSAFGLIQHFGFLEVPIMIHYELLRSIVNVSVKSGFSANFLINNHVYLQGSAYRNPVGESTGIARASLSGTGGFALSYSLTQRMDISLEPTFSMFITPISTQNNMQTHPYNYALLMGMKYKL